MGVRLLRRGRRCASEGIGLVTKRMFHMKHSFAYPIFRLFSPLPCCCQAWPALLDGGPGSARAQPSPGAHLPPLWLRPAPPLPRLNERLILRGLRWGGRASQILPLRATEGCESISCGRFRGFGYRWYGRFSAHREIDDGWVNRGFHHGKKGAEYPINVAKWGEVG